MSGYLDNFKRKYPIPNYAFLLEIEQYLKEHGHDGEAVLISHAIVNDLHITKPQFWSLRKRIAEHRDRKRIEYLTSPESETYWCS